MRFEVKIDLWIRLLFYFSIGIIIFPAFMMPWDEIVFYILITAPINILLIWILMGSYLELGDEELYIKLGPIYRKISYKNIKSISFKQSWSSSWAFTKARVEIKVYNETFFKGNLQVGPKDRVSFTDSLTRYCRNLENT